MFADKGTKIMQREQAVAACVAQMKKEKKFSAHSDEHKAAAAKYVFDRLHEDAEKNMPMGCSGEFLRNYVRAATARVEKNTRSLPSQEFEAANGFPILLVLGLIPTLYSWFKLLREWLNW